MCIRDRARTTVSEYGRCVRAPVRFFKLTVSVSVWLAPSLRYLPIRMRVSNTLRGTLEVVLASIRVDDEVRVE